MHHLFLFIMAALFDLCVSLRKTGFLTNGGSFVHVRGGGCYKKNSQFFL